MGTSLSDLTEATGLTKGAIYFNFKNKEELAVQAFKYNVHQVLDSLKIELDKAEGSDKKLFALTNYYRYYYDITKEFGGCPILNIGADTHHTNPFLFTMVKKISHRLEQGIQAILNDGVRERVFKKDLDTATTARNIYSMMEGSIFMATIHDDRMYLSQMMNLIDEMITEKLMS